MVALRNGEVLRVAIYSATALFRVLNPSFGSRGPPRRHAPGACVGSRDESERFGSSSCGMCDPPNSPARPSHWRVLDKVRRSPPRRARRAYDAGWQKKNPMGWPTCRLSALHPHRRRLRRRKAAIRRAAPERRGLVRGLVPSRFCSVIAAPPPIGIRSRLRLFLDLARPRHPAIPPMGPAAPRCSCLDHPADSRFAGHPRSPSWPWPWRPPLRSSQRPDSTIFVKSSPS